MDGLIDIMHNIKSSTKLIEALLLRRPPDFSQVSILPSYTKPDEVSGANPHSIIESYPAENPISETVKALNYITIDGDESGKLLRRWPGLHIYHSEYPELESALNMLNNHKACFKQKVDDFSKSMQASSSSHNSLLKFEYVHDKFSMLATLYVYRSCAVIHGPIRQAYWNWLRSPKSKRIDKDYVIAHLENKMASAFNNVSSESIRQRISQLHTEKTKSFIYKASQPPRPNLTLHFHDDRKPKALYGGLPAFAFSQSGEAFSYKPLKTYNAEERKVRKLRSDARKLEHYFGDFYVER